MPLLSLSIESDEYDNAADVLSGFVKLRGFERHIRAS